MICWTNVDEALKCNMSDDEDDGMKYGGINYSLGKSCLFILYFLVLWRDVSNRRQITSNQKCNEMAWDEHYFTTEQHLQSWKEVFGMKLMISSRVASQLFKRHVEHASDGLVLIFWCDGQHESDQYETRGEESQSDTHHRPLGLLRHLIVADWQRLASLTQSLQRIHRLK